MSAGVSVSDLVASSRIVVCVGSGGVGKTTVAAALALQASLQGRRAMVLTIDPARRLAQSLGLQGLRLGGERIAAEHFVAAGLPSDAVLSAGMLDQAGAWDAFIARHAPGPEVRDTILANPFYQNLSRSFAGSTEYMAIEELCRLDEAGEHDLIVLDTPPSRHALDFLEAPRRLEELFDRSVLGWLARPASAGWSAWKGASRGVRFLLERIEDATGMQALAEIASFFAAVETTIDSVTERSRRVRALLSAEGTSFVLVTSPDEQVLEDAEAMVAGMRDLGVSLGAVVTNRALADDALDSEAWARACDGIAGDLRRSGVGDDVVAWLVETAAARRSRAAAEAVRRESFEQGLAAGVALGVVPEQDHDVHDLAGLAVVAGFLGLPAPR